MSDIVRGHAETLAGRTIITLRATSREGATSRIVPNLSAAPVAVAGERAELRTQLELG